MLLMCWFCWCADAVDALRVWWADATDVLMLLMRWCCVWCWCADAVDALMLLILLMKNTADAYDTAEELIRLMLLILLMNLYGWCCLYCWCAYAADVLMLLLRWEITTVAGPQCWSSEGLPCPVYRLSPASIAETTWNEKANEPRIKTD